MAAGGYARVIMLCSTRVAVKTSVVKWVVRVRSAAAEASAESAGCKRKEEVSSSSEWSGGCSGVTHRGEGNGGEAREGEESLELHCR